METYLDDVAGMGKTVICVGSGNEGNVGGHTSGTVSPRETYPVEMGIGMYEPSVNVQIWKIIRFDLIIPQTSFRRTGWTVGTDSGSAAFSHG